MRSGLANTSKLPRHIKDRFYLDYQKNIEKHLKQTNFQYSNENNINGWYEYKIPLDKLDAVTKELPISFTRKYGNDVLLFLEHYDLFSDSYKLALEEIGFFDQAECEWWCEKNCSGKWIRIYHKATYLYYFEKPSDAIAFRLTYLDIIGDGK